MKHKLNRWSRFLSPSQIEKAKKAFIHGDEQTFENEMQKIQKESPRLHQFLEIYKKDLIDDFKKEYDRLAESNKKKRYCY